MKLFALAALATVAVVHSAKLDGPLISVLRDNSELDNGVSVDETGSAGSVGQSVVQGSYRYTSPEGEEVVVSYTADENGFVATGPWIPVAPPMPQHALDQIAF